MLKNVTSVKEIPAKFRTLLTIKKVVGASVILLSVACLVLVALCLWLGDFDGLRFVLYAVACCLGLSICAFSVLGMVIDHKKRQLEE